MILPPSRGRTERLGRCLNALSSREKDKKVKKNAAEK